MSNTDGLQVNIDDRDGVAVLSPAGDVDMNVSPHLRARLKPLVSTKNPRVVIDLSAVPYMDSSGVATLVEAMKLVRNNNGALALCGMNDRVRGIFEIARLDQYFSIHDSIEDALAHV